MAIKNMGTATMRFNQGIIVDGVAGQDVYGNDYSLITSGSHRHEGDIVLDTDFRFYLDGARVPNGPYLSGNTVALTIEGDDRIIMNFDKDVRFSGATTNNDSNSVVKFMDEGASTYYHDETDVLLWFSGSAGTLGTGNRGVAAFQGDMMCSGSIQLDGTLFSGGSQVRGITSVSTNHAVREGNYFLKCVHNSSITIELPKTSDVEGMELVIKDATGNASVNSITIDADGTEIIDGQGSFVMSKDGQCVKLIADGVDGWLIISNYYA